MIKTPPTTWCMILCVALCAAGCGSNDIEGFEHLELLPPEMELPEFSLGSFVVPIPGEIDESSTVPPRNRMELVFNLIAEISPENLDHLTAVMEHSERQIRDHIIRTCRKASFSDLEEANLVTLKTHMLDAIQPFVGPNRIHRLVISKLQKNEL